DVEAEAGAQPQLLLLAEGPAQPAAAAGRDRGRVRLALHLDVRRFLRRAIEGGERRLRDQRALELVRERRLLVEVRVNDFTVGRAWIFLPRRLDPGEHLVGTRQAELERERIDVGDGAMLDRH